METDALALARTHSEKNLPERLGYGPVDLSVTNLDRAVAFWTSVLGFVPRTEPGPGVALGTTQRTLVILHPGATAQCAKGHLGMYHVAFGVPFQAEFSRLMRRFRQLKIRHAPVDHLMSKAMYLNDPDGHGIEIALETPERFSCFRQDARGFLLLDVQGRPHSGREALDIAAELAMAENADLGAPISDEAVVAHVHLHVPALEPALDWFEGIGFARSLYLPDMGLADMGAGATYTHRLALDVWAGPGAKPAPSDSARLLGYRLTTTDPVVFDRARSRLIVDAAGRLIGIDPAGIALTLNLRPAAKIGKFAA